MSDDTTDDDHGIEQRGVYLLADTPVTAHPLAVENGDRDQHLLVEALVETLSEDEVDDLINDLVAHRVSDGGDGA